MRSIKDKVEYVLKEYPDTRNSDQYLIVMIWWCFNQDSFEGKEYVRVKDVVDKFEKMESITRCRRKLQEEGKYPSTGTVLEKRQGEAEDIRQTINHNDWWENLP